MLSVPTWCSCGIALLICSWLWRTSLSAGENSTTSSFSAEIIQPHCHHQGLPPTDRWHRWSCWGWRFSPEIPKGSRSLKTTWVPWVPECHIYGIIASKAPVIFFCSHVSLGGFLSPSVWPAGPWWCLSICPCILGETSKVLSEFHSCDTSLCSIFVIFGHLINKCVYSSL